MCRPMIRKPSIHQLANALESATVSHQEVGVRRRRRAERAVSDRNKSASRRKLSPDNFVIVVPLILFGTGFIWLTLSIVFGGLGGHLFSALSKAEFLKGSKHEYHETHEAMLAEQKLFKQRAKEWREKNRSNSPQNRKVSAYNDKKSGRLIYQEEVDLRAVLADVERELRVAEENGEIAREQQTDAENEVSENQGEEVDVDALTREEVVALVKKRKQQLKLIKKGQYQRNRADSDRDIQSQSNSEKVVKTINDKPETTITTATTTTAKTTATERLPENRPKSVNTTLASRVRIDFLENNCTTFDDEYKSVDVEYRKGSTAIKGSSLDDIDRLVKIARSCGDIKLSVYPTEAGVVENNETDRDLLVLRNSEVKYYLLLRRIPKDAIVLFDTIN